MLASPAKVPVKYTII